MRRPESDPRWLSASPWCLRKSLSLNLELTHLAGWLAELQGSICPFLELGCPHHWLLTWAPMAECRSLSYLYLVRTYCLSHLSNPSITLEASQIFLLSLPAGACPERFLFSQPLLVFGELRSFKQQSLLSGSLLRTHGAWERALEQWYQLSILLS